MMKKYIKIFIFVLILLTTSLAGEKRVLVEVLTNSHCSRCPLTHSTLDSYLQSPNGPNIDYIYYHIRFPYNDDPLFEHNEFDADLINDFYGPFTQTPESFFDGVAGPNSTTSWAASLDDLLNQDSKIDLSLSGSFSENDFIISAAITQTDNIGVSDLNIIFVVVEDINFTGRNGISEHKNVMRKIIKPDNEGLSISLNETALVSTTINKEPDWNTSNLKVIAYIQSDGSKEVFQSSSISYTDLVITDIDNTPSLSNKFNLGQNYPNPFNPTTTISYFIPSSNIVKLSVFDVIGNEVAKLVDENKGGGEHKIVFDASILANGVYYYQLRSGNLVQTKKMILLK